MIYLSYILYYDLIMDTYKVLDFYELLTDEYFIPQFAASLSNNDIDRNHKNALVASIIFNNHGVNIPFEYKLTDEQFKLYNENKHDVIDTLVWYIFDYYTCRHWVETYGVFKIIKKVIVDYGIENMERIYKDKNEDELYSYYAYYILLEYFDNIVYLSNNKESTATDKDIEELEKKIKELSNIIDS